MAPRKRPFHSIIAGFVSRNGEPLMTFGNMGGAVQPETHAQHMVNVIDHGMNVQMTTDAARFTHSQNCARAVTMCAASTAARWEAIRASCSRATRK